MCLPVIITTIPDYYLAMNINSKTIDDLVCMLQEKTYREYGEKIARHKIKFILNSFLYMIHTTVASGERVSIYGHGTYDSYTFKERNGKDPIKNQSYYIPTHQVPTFRSGEKFKQLVEKGGTRQENKDILVD